MLENAWVEFAFPYALLLHYEGANQDTIRVKKETSAKLPHHANLFNEKRNTICTWHCKVVGI